MKRTIFNIALLVFGSWLVYYQISIHRISDEGKNVFTSNVYPHYKEQILNFSKESGIKEQIAFALNSSPDLRTAHQNFITELRKDAELRLLGIDSPPFNQFIQNLYLNVESDGEDFLAKFLPPKQENSLFDYLENSLVSLRSNSQFNGLESSPYLEDPFLHGNLPSRQFVLPKGTIVFRTAHPVRDLPIYQRYIVQDAIQPEFRCFLKALSPKKHLYINVMKRKGEESYFSRQIENLENEEENIFVTTLDKNSQFYWQEGEFESLDDSERFKTTFLKKMMEKDFYWSKKIDLKLWENELSEILENVHQTYFSNQTTLSQGERQDFIELTYVLILDALVDKVEPFTANVTCKQAIDRGPSLALLWLWKSYGVGAAPKTEEALFLAPPLLVHNRPSHPSRLERLISAGNRL